MGTVECGIVCIMCQFHQAGSGDRNVVVGKVDRYGAEIEVLENSGQNLVGRRIILLSGELERYVLSIGPEDANDVVFSGIQTERD